VSRLLLIAALLSTVSCASAKRWGNLAVEDAKAVVTAPREAEAATWKKAAVITGAVVASAALDSTAERAIRSNDSAVLDDFTDAVEPLGGGHSEKVLAGFLVTGLLRSDQKMQSVAFDGFVASLIASKVITPALKSVVGRTRPNATTETFAFDEGSSFPSGHSTQAFAVASVIAAHYDQRWIDATAYGLAGAVAYARIYHDAHYLSDTVAGAVIGTAVGRFIVRTNNERRAKWTVVPVGRAGVVVWVRW
jgi:hypothetical protein